MRFRTLQALSVGIIIFYTSMAQDGNADDPTSRALEPYGSSDEQRYIEFKLARKLKVVLSSWI